MFNLAQIGLEVTKRRKALGLRQIDLAGKAEVSRATLEALENGRSRELGFNKVVKILAVLGAELALSEAGKRRPTLEDLMREDDQGLGR